MFGDIADMSLHQGLSAASAGNATTMSPAMAPHTAHEPRREKLPLQPMASPRPGTRAHSPGMICLCLAHTPIISKDLMVLHAHISRQKPVLGMYAHTWVLSEHGPHALEPLGPRRHFLILSSSESSSNLDTSTLEGRLEAPEMCTSTMVLYHSSRTHS